MKRKQKQRVATVVLLAGWGLIWLGAAMKDAGAPTLLNACVVGLGVGCVIGGAGLVVKPSGRTRR